MVGVVLVVALAGCSSSGSTEGSGPTGGTASTQQFCDDLRTLSDQVMPPIGSPMMEDNLALFDSLLDEAPTAVKGSVKKAADAAHAQADKVTAEGTRRIADGLKKAGAWASKNCPAPASD